MSQPLYFITSSTKKLHEVQTLLPGIQQLALELDEIQSLDTQVVIEHKLGQAALHHTGRFIVEDTSLSLACLNGLPGTYVKSFISALGLAGVADLASRYDDQTAVAQATIGYRDDNGQSHYVSGKLRGRLVPPRNGQGFGWDDIFIPEGYDQTFSELGPDIKQSISHRRQAVDQLRTLLGTTAP